MAVLDYIYKNAALDQAFDDASDFVTIGAPNGSTDYAVFYIGTPTSGNQLQDASNPGVDSIEVSIVDSASGSGVEDTNIKLALDPADFATTTNASSVSTGGGGGISSPLTETINSASVWTWTSSDGLFSFEIPQQTTYEDALAETIQVNHKDPAA